MKSKMLIVLTAGLLIGAQEAKQNPAIQEVQKAIGTLNDAFAKRDADSVRRLMIDEHLSITAYYGGPATKADQLKSVPDLQLTEYKAGELKVTMLTEDVALVAYPLAQKGTFKQRPVAAKNYASAVWIKREGKWLEASYQETPLSGD